MRVLLVEDEADLAQALSSALRRERMIVQTAGSLREAEEAVLAAEHDLVVLDRRLPDGDGLALLDFLQRASVAVPVLMLTARSDVADRVDGLNQGADDYLAKPFSMDELLARMRALARRPAARLVQQMNIGRLRFDCEARQAFVGEEALILPRRELLALEALLRSKGRTVMRSALLERVYEGAEDVRSNALDAHLSRLRAKLEQAEAGVVIHAIRGVGYLVREAG